MAGMTEHEKDERDLAILRAYDAKDSDTVDIAKLFRVPHRYVQRLIKEALTDGN